MRRAWAKLDALVERYQALRTARTALAGLGERVTKDVDYGIFGEFRIAPDVWPISHIRQAAMKRDVSLLPTDPRERLLAIAASDLQPWIPTAAEQDAAYDEYAESQGWHKQLPSGAMMAGVAR